MIQILKNLPQDKQLLLIVLASIVVIPLAFIILNPEGGSIVFAFLSFGFYERVWNQIHEKYPEPPIKPKLLTGAVAISAFAITTAAMVLLFIPICRWIEMQETLNIRFLNRELTYGLALCYEGVVDFVTLGFGAFVAYLLVPIFYLIYQLFRLPFVLFKTIRR